MATTAREAALNALEKCRRDGAWSGAAIDQVIKKAGLDARDAALAARLCLGVMQNGALFDYYISVFCTQSAKKLEPKVRDILRLGIYQLLYMDKIPARAAVNESVALCRKAGYARAAGLVNAVLRRVSENVSTLPPVPNQGSSEHLAVKYSHPIWLVSRIIKERGYEFAEAFFSQCNIQPNLDIQINTLKTSVDDYLLELKGNGIDYIARKFPHGCVELSGGAVKTLPKFDEGHFFVQDRAARMAVEIAAPKRGDNVLDACSAPGGKAFSAAVRMGNVGHILACDIHEKKLSLIRQGAERLGIDIITTQPRDARTPDYTLRDSFDVVIADVPCSGFGVIRKKPEIRFKTEQEIAQLPEIQLAILNNLSQYVKVGGVLLYSTCTVLKAENEDVVNNFLAHNPDYTLAPFMLGDECVADGMCTFWPNVDQTDGFFAARLIRKR